MVSNSLGPKQIFFLIRTVLLCSFLILTSEKSIYQTKCILLIYNSSETQNELLNDQKPKWSIQYSIIPDRDRNDNDGKLLGRVVATSWSSLHNVLRVTLLVTNLVIYSDLIV